MAVRIRLTDERVEALDWQAGGDKVNDYYDDTGNPKGFLVCILKGVKTFSYKWSGGMISLGHFPEVSVEEARVEALRL